MKAALIAGALIVATAAPVMAAPGLTAGEFLSRAEPLLKKSKLELAFSGEARRLMKIVGQAAQRNRAQHDADRAAGRQPSACLPPKGKAELDVYQLLAHIRALPAAAKAASFDSAFASYTARKYPCRG